MRDKVPWQVSDFVSYKRHFYLLEDLDHGDPTFTFVRNLSLST